MRRAAIAAIALAALVVGAAATRAVRDGPADDRPIVLAAASLTEVLPRLHPDARYSFAASSQLAEQVRQGAPFDVFLSASPVYAEALHGEGLVLRPVVFATNSIVLVVPRTNPQRIRTVSDLGRRPELRLVAAAPQAPIGLYTREALERLGLVGVLRKAVSVEPDVKGIVGKIALGEADAGIVYRTDARVASGKVKAIALPERAQPTVRYEGAVAVSPGSAEGARAFLAELLSANGRRALRAAGFGLP